METQPDGKFEEIDRLADEFARRLRIGERPTLDEYADRYPELAVMIRELFPALVHLEAAQALDDRGDGHPRSIGDYRILRVIGRGGMGVVYEARQASLGRRVALKILPLHRTRDPKSVERFRREARSAAKLHHTNIVPVFEIGQIGESCFYAMQFIDGLGLDRVIEDLRQLRQSSASRPITMTLSRPSSAGNDVSLTRSLLTSIFRQVDLIEGKDEAPCDGGPMVEGFEDAATGKANLPGQTDSSSVFANRRRYFESVALIGRQVAGALAYAHDRGIVHRDIKPSNLLLDSSGIAWVADFGLAKTNEESLTETGDLLGTYRYMPPERFQGEGDRRVDVYALGLTLYELLLLQPAFTATDPAQLLKSIQDREPDRPRSVVPEIPGDLETIILKAIAKDPARRYQSAGAMGEDLRRFLAGEPIQARRTHFLDRGRLWCRRYPALAALYVVLIASVAGAAVAAVYLNGLLRESEHERVLKEAAEKDAVEELFDSLLAQANASRFQRKIGQRFETLETVRKAAAIALDRGMPAEKFDRLRTIAIAALALPDIRRSEAGEPLGPDYSGIWNSGAAGRMIACAYNDRSIVVRRVRDGSVIATLKFEARVGGLGISPDGRYLVADGANHFRVWDLSTREPRSVAHGEHDGWRFHPDSRHLAIVGRDQSLDLIDLTDQDPVRPLVEAGKDHLSDLRFNPEGSKLAVSIGGSAQILDARSGKVLWKLNHSSWCRGTSWAPSARYVALVLDPHSIEIWDVESRVRLNTLEGCTSGGLETEFSPDGTLLASWGWEGKVRIWDVRSGKQKLQDPVASAIAFDADGQCLIKLERQFYRAEFASGSEYRVLKRFRSDNDAFGVTIHPDGRLLVAMSSEGLHFLDLETGDEILTDPFSSYSLRFASHDELLINSKAGLLALPVRFGPESGSSTIRIGPPDRLRQGSNSSFATGQAGNVICQGLYPDDNAALIRRRGGSSTIENLECGEPCSGTAISPDGRFVVTFTTFETGKTRVWDVDSRRRLAELDTGGAVLGDFSPDHRWLALQGHKRSRLIPVGDWEQGRSIEWRNAFAFSPDSKLLALETGAGVIRLVDIESGHERARLEDPNQDGAVWMNFTPDGTRLVTFNRDNVTIHVWDLRLIRRQLAKLGLDWEGPAFPPETRSPRPSSRLRVELDLVGKK